VTQPSEAPLLWPDSLNPTPPEPMNVMLADIGSDWYFQGTRADHWGNHLLDQLKTVPASAFEAVDVSGCMVDADSAKADCPE
jgi:hypothetical protein